LLLERFAKLLAWCRPGVLIVTHRNADVDAVAAAFTLNYVLRSYGEGVSDICVPEGVDLASKKILSALGFSVPKSGKCVGKRIVLIDVSTLAQVEDVEFSECSVVDHHVVNSVVEVCGLAVYDPKAGATSALIAEALMNLGFTVPRAYATLLLAGIMFDTRFLRIASSRLLRVVSWLLDVGGDLEEVSRLLTHQEIPYSERIAKLKSLSRMGIYVVGEDNILTMTCVGAYEASSLRVALDAGSDIAIAVAPREDSARVVIRVSSRLLQEFKTPVAAELARYLGENLGGSGGGHEAAAGVVIPLISIRSLEDAVFQFFRLRGYKVRALDRGRWMEECT